MSLIPLNHYSQEVLKNTHQVCNWHMNHGGCTNESCNRDHPDVYSDIEFNRINIRSLIGTNVQTSQKLSDHLGCLLRAGIRTFDISQMIRRSPGQQDNFTIYKTILRNLCQELEIDYDTIEFVRKSINITWTGLIDLDNTRKTNLIAIRKNGDIYQTDAEIVDGRKYAAEANAKYVAPIHKH